MSMFRSAAWEIQQSQQQQQKKRALDTDAPHEPLAD
jgi:hypothetical protein